MSPLSADGEKSSNKKHRAPREIVKEGPFTYDDYAAIDDGQRYELFHGNLELMSPAPSPVHQVVIGCLFERLKNSCFSDYLILGSPVDVILSTKEIRQPDLVAVHRSRLHIITERAIEGPPDLAAEVVSPSSAKRDRQQKLWSYARYGIPEYWIVISEIGSLEQYVLQGESNEGYGIPTVYTVDETIRSERMPCVSFSMRDVLRDVPRLPGGPQLPV